MHLGGRTLSRARCRVDCVTMRALDRRIWGLALPALGALAAEPIFLLADTAMVGHLGAGALGALAIAGTIVQTVLGLMVFLAYATTPRVARHLGSGDQRAAVGAGFDGIWLALVCSAVLVAGGLPLLGWLLGLIHPAPEVAAGALSYLTISWWGLPFMLVVVAATGLLRGLQDTKTPLLVAAGGFGLNIALNALFIYGLGMGVAGSALGTVCAHAAMCAVYIVIAIRAARRFGADLRPDWAGVLAAARTSGWLLVRNASLRGGLIVLIAAATALGTAQLAALQVAQTLFNSLALVLDSIAIAGQALIGLELGRRDRAGVVAVQRRLLLWGTGFGVVVGVPLACASPWVGTAFTSDGAVRALLAPLVLVLALCMPIAGWVFTLDGILMGAEDARYLALAQVVSFLVLAACAWAAMAAFGSLTALWASFCFGFMGARAVTLGLRMRGQGWIERAEARA